MENPIVNNAVAGMNLDTIISNLKQSEYTYALNAICENFDGNSYTVQNEEGNILCTNFPENYRIVGAHNIIEKNLIVFFLSDGQGNSEFGVVDTLTCLYIGKINAACLNFSLDRPILQIVHKVTNCSTEVYFTDGLQRRFIDLDNLPYKEVPGTVTCENDITTEIDCNKLSVQPNFSIPQIEIQDVDNDGDLQAGTVQFGVQYSNANSEAYTSVYSVTNPMSIFDPFKITQDFNYSVGKSVVLNITNIDTTGYYDYFNVIVIKTVNNISTPYLVGTYKIVKDHLTISYTGQNKQEINLTMFDVLEKYPYYENAGGLTTAQDVLIWNDLKTSEQINYQSIWSKVELGWETYRLNGKKPYAKEKNVVDIKGYFRDEVYALEGAFLLKNGQQTDSFHIPGRKANPYDLDLILNDDSISEATDKCSPDVLPLPRWQVYNTGSLTGNVNRFCPPPQQPTGDIQVSFSTACLDLFCTEQSTLIVNLTFNQATTQPFSIRIGQIVGGASSFAEGYVPMSLIPPGVTTNGIPAPNSQVPPYGANNNPESFTIHIPSGTTTYQWSFPAGTIIPFGGLTCQSCIFPIQAMYFEPISVNNDIRLNISTPQNINVHVQNPPLQVTDPVDEPQDCIPLDDCYEGPWEYGDFAYVESTDYYPCKPEVWGDLSDTPIRHHKFPDSSITHIHDDQGYIYPIGIRIDMQQIVDLINNSNLTQDQKDNIVGFKVSRGNRATNKSIVARGLINNVGKYNRDNSTFYYPNYPYNDLNPDVFISTAQTAPDTGSNDAFRLRGFDSDSSKERYTFHSPDTHFFQPTLGNILKLETIEYGKTDSHFVQVKNNARYKILKLKAYEQAFKAGMAVGFTSASYGSGNIFNGTAAAATMDLTISLITKLVPYINYAYQYNSIGNYSKFKNVFNTGNKQRHLDIASYTFPGIISVGDDHSLNNFQRESSVYVKTLNKLPFPTEADPSVPSDDSRYTISQTGNCLTFQGVINRNICSYYATIKKHFSNQYGQMYSYESVDTGFQRLINIKKNVYPTLRYQTIFGGDCFINQFSYKTKFPFFIDNRVNAVDDADVFYDEIGNIAYPTYWMSTDVAIAGGSSDTDIKQFFGEKINNFDCVQISKNDFYKIGKFYLFAYGIPTLFCESEVNVDLRQAYNNKEGDFYPHVAFTTIPDDWLHETAVSIANDNTYLYNKTYSKQNKEDIFTHLPEDYSSKACRRELHFRAIFSERQEDLTNYRRNNWLIYRPAAKFDFPQNFGKLTSLDGIEDKQVLARFENKCLLYNALLTMPTSTVQAYLGQSLFSQQVPPLDYADTDLGYLGSQHKFLLKTEYGHITCDAKRGQVFIINNQNVKELTNENVSKFFTEFLQFEIGKAFPTYNIDNNYNGCGLTGVYDPKYDRFILTKIDYKPLVDGIILEDNKFYYNKELIEFTNPTYFCNNSFTISYSFKLQSWTSFHSYIPNYYVGNSSFFYAGENNTISSLWKHNSTFTLFNNFFGKLQPYIIEYPIYYKGNDEILQNIKDYSKILKYSSYRDFVETDDTYFSHAVIYNNQQCSGTLKLTKKPKGLSALSNYPVYSAAEKEILYTKSNSFYNFNTFWALQKSSQEPMWVQSCESLSIYKELNNSNMNYSKRAFNKAPMMSKDCRIRLINNTIDTHKFISEFILSNSQISYK
jgi:hypothetical protein